MESSMFTFVSPTRKRGKRVPLACASGQLFGESRKKSASRGFLGVLGITDRYRHGQVSLEKPAKPIATTRTHAAETTMVTDFDAPISAITNASKDFREICWQWNPGLVYN